MEYKIIEIAPVEGDDDVLVTVAYWYNDFVSWLDREPDFIEQHLIGDIPRQQPIRNRVGQYLGKDNVWISPWVLNENDQWVDFVPDMKDVQHEDVNLDDYILPAIDARAQKVKENPPTAKTDFFRPNELKHNRKVQALGRDPRVLKHLNRSKRI